MRCPVCRAEKTEGPSCRRCRADLSLLFALDEQRADLMRQALQEAQAAHWPEVICLAGRAHSLRRDTDSGRLLAVAWLMARDYVRAWEQYQDLAPGPQS
jgi:hypothetical protein